MADGSSAVVAMEPSKYSAGLRKTILTTMSLTEGKVVTRREEQLRRGIARRGAVNLLGR